MKKFFLFLLIILTIGVGIFVLTGERETFLEPPDTPLKNNEDSSLEFFEPSEERARNIIRNALDARFNVSTATYTVANLDGAAGPELIIGAVENISSPNTATILVVTIKNQEGQYTKIGAVEYEERLNGVPEVKRIQDITSDGQPEIIMSLMFGGAASWAEGILQVDVPGKKLNWLQMQTQQGQMQDAIFLLAASTGYHTIVNFTDIDSDGQEELVEIFAQRLPFEEKKTTCTVNAYKWNGNLFAYNDTLSQQVLSQLDSECTI